MIEDALVCRACNAALEVELTTPPRVHCPSCKRVYSVTVRSLGVQRPSSRSALPLVLGVISAVVLCVMVVAVVMVGGLMAVEPHDVQAEIGPEPEGLVESAEGPPEGQQDLPAEAAVPGHPEYNGLARATYRHHSESTVLDFTYLFGELTNSSSIPLRSPYVHAVLLDSEGKEVGVEKVRSANGCLDVGESEVVMGLFKTVPYASMRFEVVANPARACPPRPQGLVAEVRVVRPAPYSADKDVLSGVLHNRGEQTVQFASVQVITFDAQDRVIHSQRIRVDVDELAAGSTGRFESNQSGLPRGRREVRLHGRLVE